MSGTATRRVTDALGRELILTATPRRIVSLVPSLTHTLFALGLGERVVGRTRYCDAPAAQVEAVPVIGGTKQFDAAAIAALEPDLILAAKEENPRDITLALAEYAPVYVTDVVDVDGALAMLRQLGEVLGVTAAAAQMASDIEAAWRSLPRLSVPPRSLYFIWRKPWMVVGADTYIDAVLARLGFDNLGARPDSDEAGRYPVLDDDRLRALDPELVLLSSEPYPFADTHRQELAKILPDARIELVDGAAFSWYGARMLEAASVFTGLLRRLG